MSRDIVVAICECCHYEIFEGETAFKTLDGRWYCDACVWVYDHVEVEDV